MRIRGGDKSRGTGAFTGPAATLLASGAKPITPEPPPTGSAFLFGMTESQIQARPGSGAAFNNVKANADASFVPDLNTNSSTNGGRAFAAGLMYVYFKNSNPTLANTYRNKVISGCEAIRTGTSWWLQGIIRQLPGWILAADLVNHRTSAWVTWLADLRFKTNSSTNPQVTPEARWVYGLWHLAHDTCSNHGTLGMSALTAIDRFIGDANGVADDLHLFKGYCGVPGGWPTSGGITTLQNPVGWAWTQNGNTSSRSWTLNNGAAGWIPIGPSQAMATTPVQKDGAVIEDVSRDGGNYALDAQNRPIPGPLGIQYTGTAACGFVLNAVLLEPVAGPEVWQYSDRAMWRWRDWLRRYGPWDDGRVSTSHPWQHQGVGGWMDSLLNKKYNENFPLTSTTSYSFGQTTWLYGT